MVFPIGDDQVKGGSFPMFSYGFIALNVLIFLYQFMVDPQELLACQYGSIPNEIANGQDWITVFTSMFMHGGWMHLIGNMAYLWIFADNIEATVGNVPFVAFYFLGGIAATVLHIIMDGMFSPEALADCCNMCTNTNYADCTKGSDGSNICPGSIPSVGASGAIAAVLGSYLVLFPKSRIKMISVFGMFRLPAILFLGFWIAQQFFSGFSDLGRVGGGTAWWAHIGGFLFGVIAGFFAKGSVQKAEDKYNDRDFL